MSDVSNVVERALAAGTDAFTQEDEGTPSRRLVRMAELIPQCVPSCCGATTTLWRGDDRSSASSHPDLAELVDVQVRTGEGTIPAALESNATSHVTDVLDEDRWPHYRTAALDTGIRSCVTVPFRRDGLALTVTAYRFRPGPLRQAEKDSMAMLGELLVSAVVRDSRYEEALAVVGQMDTALRSRPVVDQACGILMHALGCDADDAFATLRRISQKSNEKLVEVARMVVSTRGRNLRPGNVEV